MKFILKLWRLIMAFFDEIITTKFVSGGLTRVWIAEYAEGIEVFVDSAGIIDEVSSFLTFVELPCNSITTFQENLNSDNAGQLYTQVVQIRLPGTSDATGSIVNNFPKRYVFIVEDTAQQFYLLGRDVGMKLTDYNTDSKNRNEHPLINLKFECLSRVQFETISSTIVNANVVELLDGVLPVHDYTIIGGIKYYTVSGVPLILLNAPSLYGKYSTVNAIAGASRPTINNELLFKGKPITQKDSANLSIPFLSLPSDYIWLAIPYTVPVKTSWKGYPYNEFNEGEIGGSVQLGGELFPDPVLLDFGTITYRNGVTLDLKYNVYLSNYQTEVAYHDNAVHQGNDNELRSQAAIEFY